MNIQQRQAEYIKLFSQFDNWEDRYSEIVKLGKTLEPLPEEFRDEKFKVKGCQSQVWLGAKLIEGKVNFYADSDAMIVKGIIALLVSTFNNETPNDILKADMNYLDEIGLKQHLSMNRSNGLSSMMKQIKMYAMVFSTQV